MKLVKSCFFGSMLLFLNVLQAQTDAVVPMLDLLLFDESSPTIPPPNECNDPADSDGDRLANCFETNDGNFISATQTGTNPLVADTDGDGINDGDEVLGTLAGLNLPALGLNPLRKNILLEYDWFTDSTECNFHSHRPTISIINKVAQAFVDAPVPNPDGSTGIYMIQDYGQGGVFSGGNYIFDADGLLTGGVSGSEFQNHKNANFASNRNGYFRYVLLPHRYNTSSSSSGQAELPGDDSIVSLYCFNSTQNVANTIMHELGHNLNLRHGGHENCNYKPNYNSVMNYQYQFPGVDSDSSCDAQGDNILSYSPGQRISLNELNLNENSGVCGTQSIDWNNDGFVSSSVAFNVNSDDDFEVSNCGGTFTTLNDHNDWSNIYYLGLNDADGLSPLFKEIITDTLVPDFLLLNRQN